MWQQERGRFMDRERYRPRRYRQLAMATCRLALTQEAQHNLIGIQVGFCSSTYSAEVQGFVLNESIVTFGFTVAPRAEAPRAACFATCHPLNAAWILPVSEARISSALEISRLTAWPRLNDDDSYG